jgi:Glycosyl transferase family 11
LKKKFFFKKENNKKKEEKMLLRFGTTHNISNLEEYKNFSTYHKSKPHQLKVNLGNEITSRLVSCLLLDEVSQICTNVPLTIIPPHFQLVTDCRYQRPLVTVWLTGGLGNRLFQLATAHQYAKKYHKTLVLARDRIQHCAHSSIKYEDELFTKLPVVDHFPHNAVEIEEKEADFSTCRDLPDFPGQHVLLRGYFQSPGYIDVDFGEDCLLETFYKPPIQRRQTAFLHVRRGDYVNNKFHYVNLTGYYLEAMRRHYSNFLTKRIIVCSNDIEWCKRQWFFSSCEFFSGNEIQTLELMVSCEKGGICSNSTFSWWAAWFSQSRNNFIPNVWLPARPEWKTEFSMTDRIHSLDVKSWFLPIRYVNLKHREDRNNECLTELKKLQADDIKRFDAIYFADRGHLGCATSHVHLLEEFLHKTSLPCLMIIEDDFELAHLEAKDTLLNFVMREEIGETGFDVLLLGGGSVYCSHEASPGVFVLVTSQETVGYVVNRKGALKLLHMWKESVVALDNENIPQHEHCIDQKWKTLHQQGNSFILQPVLCRQRLSFSDIERRVKS